MPDHEIEVDLSEEDANLVKGPDPAKWGTLDQRAAHGAFVDLGMAGETRQATVDLSDIPEDEHDQYLVKGPDPAEWS